MPKIVFNACHGGFSLSESAQAQYLAATGQDPEHFYDRDVPRDDPHLAAIVEADPRAASGDFADLVVVDWPDGMPYQIDEYDGYESVSVDPYELCQTLLTLPPDERETMIRTVAEME